MEEVANPSPSRTKSKRTRSSQSKDGHRERLQKKSSSPNSTPPRSTTRPSLASRTASAPLVPSLLDHKVEILGFESDGHNHRDSITSIKDDPFFRNYQSPQSVSLARELISATHTQKLRDEGSPQDPAMQTSGRMTNDSVNMPPQSRSGMADINIAVIGSAGVGKSTLIQRAFGKRLLPTSIPSSIRMSVDHIAYTVSLIELDLESFDVPPNGRIQFPKQIDGLYILPRMDGALLLYDVMNRGSTTDIVQVLNGLVSSSIPTILVSCKCDNPENTRQVNVESMEEECAACVEAVKTAANVPESARMCLSVVLRAIMAHRNTNHIPEHPGTRRRATSSANLDKPSEAATSRPLSQNSSKHSRASSDYSLLRTFPNPPLASSRGQVNRSNTRTNLHHQYTLPEPHEAPPLSAHPLFRHDNSADSNDRLNPSQRTKSPLPSLGKAAETSFLDMEESDAESTYRYSEEIPMLQRDNESFFDKPARVAGVTFEELVDRLLGQNMSRADHNFSDIFLCLYRKFAAPGELFDAILSRLDRIACDRNIHYLTRTATQLRIITVVAKWVNSYPGDFASPSTSAKLVNFIQDLASDPVFAAAAQDMRGQLLSRVVEDDDTGWARTDADVESEANSNPESGTLSPVQKNNSAKDEFEESMKRLGMDDEITSLERQQSTVDSNSSGRPLSPTNSLAPSFHTVEDYERAAALMIPQTNLPLTKFRYHIFMDKSDDDFADEMTRIDWIMFSSIRLRDLVRHVSLSLNQKEKCRSLANVNRMIDHFNHVAKWVSNMILMRDKAKHRALMLEKYMNIALKLRQLKNYNGLAAVLAGINGSAIHRLAQTRALVPAEVQKRFATLVVLMGTQKSHFAYRLAWENSSLPRIPFIPLHRRDLVSAEEGSRTFVGAKGERINWKKFEVLSEVILPIMKSQVVPYPNLRRRDDIRELILDCKMPTDEEDIYQRSLQLESSSGSLEGGKKKFPWFQK